MAHSDPGFRVPSDNYEVFVPVAPSPDRARVLFEIFERDTDGAQTGMAFTSLEKFVDQLGEYQPWMKIKMLGYTAELLASDVEHVQIDPVVPAAARQWNKERLDAYLETT